MGDGFDTRGVRGAFALGAVASWLWACALPHAKPREAGPALEGSIADAIADDGDAGPRDDVSSLDASDGDALDVNDSGPFDVTDDEGGDSARADGGDAGCPAGAERCGAGCARLSEDHLNCGACANACRTGGRATATCVAGVCGLACDRGYGDCDGDPSNGCEASLESTEHCGTCANRCTGTTPICDTVAVTCTGMCRAPTVRCDNMCVDPMTDSQHCGGCGRRCALANATSSCARGACAVTACAAGYGDCDANPVNGCETTVTSSLLHCGACGNRCALANASPACTSGACAIAACFGTFRDCDRGAANGCEVDIASDAANCGACGTVCAIANGTSSCVGTACRVRACDPGFGDCDFVAMNGCEVPLATTAAHCGACHRPCFVANGTPACVASRCEVSACNPNFGDCDGMAANGCETYTGNSLTHCGACGNRCVLANATALCNAGACVIAACAGGYRDCDANPANGCERMGPCG
jgi:hypothetical protein